jgi:hypothetical protein
MLAGVTAAAVWYAGDRARLRAEAQSRGREANAALDQAEKHLKGLRDKLDDPLQVRELLSDIDRWQSMVEQARQDWRRAEAATGNDALVVEETRARIQAVETAVAREEAAYELARELDDIAVGALASSDSKMSPQLKAVAEYERVFSLQGLDVHQPGTAWFASRIRSSPARFALIGALDNWAWLAGSITNMKRRQLLTRPGVILHRQAWIGALREDPQLARLLELARAADPDPWRDRFRDPAVWTDRAALTRLAGDPDVGRQSPMVLTSLAYWLASNEGDPTALYARVLVDHPRDFWLHLHAAMLARDPGARVGLALAAIAMPPGSAGEGPK